VGVGLEDAPPDHSTISRTRRLIALEAHRAVFTWVLQCLSAAGLVKGKTIGIDAPTLEANAALRSIVRRDTGESYEEFLTKLAKASGIGTPTRADLARVDRKRKKKGSNDDWTHPHDPDAKITKMKDGRSGWQPPHADGSAHVRWSQARAHQRFETTTPRLCPPEPRCPSFWPPSQCQSPIGLDAALNDALNSRLTRAS
jgi:hypothetical protein